MTTMYGGLCDGGPYHGKPLYHGLQTIRVARRKSDLKAVTWFGPATSEIRVDEYRFVKGRWVWKEKT